MLQSPEPSHPTSRPSWCLDAWLLSTHHHRIDELQKSMMNKILCKVQALASDWLFQPLHTQISDVPQPVQHTQRLSGCHAFALLHLSQPVRGVIRVGQRQSGCITHDRKPAKMEVQPKETVPFLSSSLNCRFAVLSSSHILIPPQACRISLVALHTQRALETQLAAPRS